MTDLDLDDGRYRAADDLAGVRQRAVLARKLAGKIGPITAERFARDLEELATEVERLKAERDEARDQERARFVAWLREHAGDTNCLDDCELFTEYADLIERGEFDDLAAGDE